MKLSQHIPINNHLRFRAKPKRFSRFISLALCVLILSSCSVESGNSIANDFAASAGDAQRLPNIIFIMADDLGYGDIEPYGQKIIKTPNLSHLANAGMRFTQHYAGSTVCAPSRSVLMTGRHTGNAYIRGNYELGGFSDAEERGQLPLKSNTVTLATVLKQAGYKTGAFGKWGLGGPGSEGLPTKQGFDEFLGYLDQKQAHNYYPTHLWHGTTKLAERWFALDNPPINVHPRFNRKERWKKVDAQKRYKDYMGNEYAPDPIAKRTLEFIREHKNDPFFLYLAYVAPHAALQVPDSELAEYDFLSPEQPHRGEKGYTPHPRPRAARAAMISYMDKAIGDVIDLIDELKLGKDTLIIFTSDNGPAVEGGGDLAFFNSAGGLRGRKRDLYEGGIRVPFIAMWPGQIKAGSTSDHISAFWDLMPTFADIAGVDINTKTDGISFKPTLLGKPQTEQHESLYWEFHESKPAQAVLMGQWKGIRRYSKRNMNQIPALELYDLSTDIGENNDVAAKHPDIVKKIISVMDSRTVAEIDNWNFGQDADLANAVGHNGNSKLK